MTTGSFLRAVALAAAFFPPSCSSEEEDSRRGPDDACDPVAQDCEDEGQRCILVREGSDGPTHTECSTIEDDVGDHEICERIDDAMGEDTCAEGLFCTLWEIPESDPLVRQCLPYCHSDSDCGAGTYCQSISSSEWTGACTIACDIFGDDCDPGVGCIITQNFGSWSSYCMGSGGGLVGDPCEYGTDCAPRHVCVISSDNTACAAFCDDSHPCEVGSCMPLANTGLLYSYCNV